jgi:hypothetical protein
VKLVRENREREREEEEIDLRGEGPSPPSPPPSAKSLPATPWGTVMTMTLLGVVDVVVAVTMDRGAATAAAVVTTMGDGMKEMARSGWMRQEW